VASRWSPAAAVGLAGLAVVLLVAAVVGPLRRAERTTESGAMGGAPTGTGAAVLPPAMIPIPE